MEKLKRVQEKWNDTKERKTGYLNKFYQYEYLLDPPFEYACNLECRLNNYEALYNGTCNDITYKDAKRVVLLYHFVTRPFDEDNKIRAYTLMKFESDFSLSSSHLYSAVNRKKRSESSIYSNTARRLFEN